jgi:hypothetical protein
MTPRKRNKENTHKVGGGVKRFYESTFAWSRITTADIKLALLDRFASV